MKTERDLTSAEKAILLSLLNRSFNTRQYIHMLDGIRAMEMNDGNMGSLLLLPTGASARGRSFGREIVSGEFIDIDGVPVSIVVNVDHEDRLYELDVWKANFAPLRVWPNPSSIVVKEVQEG